MMLPCIFVFLNYAIFRSSESSSALYMNDVLEERNSIEANQAEADESVQNTEDLDLWSVLLSAADIVSTANSEKCCFRQEHYVTLGTDILGEIVTIDVGKCSQKCKHHRLPRIEKILLEDGYLKEEEIALEKTLENITENSYNRKMHTQHYCHKQDLCEPVSINVEKFPLMDGLKDIEIIQDCHCTERSNISERRPKILVYYPETPYEIAVDIGTCKGLGCDEDQLFQPLKNRSVTIQGPNGAECLKVIESCACSESCYRMNSSQVYYEVVTDELTGETKEIFKEIDVGICTGTCPSGVHYRCVLWDEEDPELCVMSLAKRAAECIPISHVAHTFITRGDKKKKVLSIDQCSCK